MKNHFILAEEEKQRIKNLHRKKFLTEKRQQLKEFAGPEEYIVRVSVPAIDEYHARQIIEECLTNGCPEKLDNLALLSASLRLE